MRYPAIIVLALMTSACAGKQNFDTMAVGKYVDSSLAQVSTEKRYASLYPNAIAPFARGTVRLKNPETAGPDLLITANGKWQGTLDDLTRNVARKAGYSVRADGERSGAPIFVSVNWDGLAMIGVLEEAYGQGKGSAWLEIDQAQRSMTIHYARRERSPIPHLDDTTL